MKSIQLQCALFPLNSQPNHIKQLDTPKEPLTCFASNIETLRLTNSQGQKCRFSQTRTKAMNTSAHDLVLTLAAPPAKTPEELWAFAGTSVLLFFMFWVSNFVVPQFISKYYEFDKVNENQKENDEDDEDDDD